MGMPAIQKQAGADVMERVNDVTSTTPVIVLIVEDDPLIVDFLKLGLRLEGFDVQAANDGKTAIQVFHQCQPALVILDLRLPQLSGEEVCKSIRAESNVPIMVLTAIDQVNEKVKLFELGADDYLVKPFNFDELLARIHALLRRTGASGRQQHLRFLDVEEWLDRREVLRAGLTIQLTAKEFDLLHLFMSNPHRVFSKEEILNVVWGYEYYGDSNIVEVYVGHLRRKLGDPVVIQTVHGVGYALRLRA
jgi:two-component system response regulator MprA